MSYRIEKGNPLDSEIRRIAEEEISGVAASLENVTDDRQTALHSARKRLKKLRGLIKLMRPASPDFHASENTRYRDLARSLAPVRDADALVETADRFLAKARDPEKASRIAAVREYLVARRDSIVQEHQEAAFPAALASLAKGREKLADLVLPQDQDETAELLARGAKDMLKKARKALKRARTRGDADDFHELRKALKYHRMHMSLFEKLRPETTGRRRKAESLGEKLGELNDIDIMHALLRDEEEKIALPEAVHTFRKLLLAREKALRKTCLRQAEDFLSADGKGIARGMRKAA